MKVSHLILLANLLVLIISGCSSNPDIQVSASSTQVILTNPPTALDSTSDQREETLQFVKNAQRVCLEIDQGNSEAEPNFSQAFSEYVGYFLNQLGKDILAPGNACDVILSFSLTVEPKGGKYQGADEMCYTGAEITGELSVAPAQGEPIIYPIQWNDPITEGAITRCPTKQETPFYQAYADPTVTILSDLWGVPIYVYAFVKDIEFKNIGSVNLGPSIERTVLGSRNFLEDRIQALGKEAVPGLTMFLTDMDDSIRYGAVTLLYSVADQTDEAIPILIELLDDNFVVVAEVEGYDDLYPIRLTAHGTLVEITGQDWGYDKVQWYQALNRVPPAPTGN